MPSVACAWSALSLYIERIRQRSSARSAIFGKSSLIHRPDCPRCLNSHLRPLEELHRAPVVRREGVEHLLRHLVGLVVVGDQLRLVVERIDVRHAAAHVEKDHALGLRREMRRLRRERIVGRRRPRRAARRGCRGARASCRGASGGRCGGSWAAYRLVEVEELIRAQEHARKARPRLIRRQVLFRAKLREVGGEQRGFLRLGRAAVEGEEGELEALGIRRARAS